MFSSIPRAFRTVSTFQSFRLSSSCSVGGSSKPATKTPDALALTGRDLNGLSASLRAVDNAVITSKALFENKLVVLFGVPGAFTPTCSSKHVPAFISKASELKAKGVNQIVCVSVNDRFVMDAWGNQLKVGENVEMLSDFDGSFVKSLGLDLDLTAAALGPRCKRFALLVKDGVVVHAEVEESAGELKVSGPEPILQRLQEGI